MELNFFLVIAACTVGFIMTWSVGANDLANVMSPAIGSKALSVRETIIIAILFEFAGAILGGSHVTNTIREGIINPETLIHAPNILAYGMLSVLMGSSCWMLLASYRGMPISITNAIVGSIVGFGIIIIGPQAMHWQKIGYIALSWIISPTLAGILAFFLFKSIQKSILGTVTPFMSAKYFMPLYLFIIGIILSFILVLKGLHHFNIFFSTKQNAALMTSTSIIVVLIGMWFMHYNHNPNNKTLHEQLIVVEKMFSTLVLLTACTMIFAHGSNDVALSIGPLVAITNIVAHGGRITADPPLPTWVIVFGCLGVITGLIMYGRKVIETVGSGITALTPSRAFAATLSAATTVVLSTSMGIPVSATQTLVGAVLGVGLARGIGALNLTVIRNIFMSWIITIPIAATLTIVFYSTFKKLLA